MRQNLATQETSNRKLTRCKSDTLKYDGLCFPSIQNLARCKSFQTKSDKTKKFQFRSWCVVKTFNSKPRRLDLLYFKIWCDVFLIISKSDMFWNLYFKIWPDEKCNNQNVMRSEILISKSNVLFSLNSKSVALNFFKFKIWHVGIF